MPARTAEEARHLALGLLARREHSERELRTKLRARGFEAACVEAALEALRALGAQSDARFAEERTRALTARGYGSRHVPRDLRARGVAEDAARRCMAQAAAGDAERAAQALERRGRHDRERNRRFLAARGYPHEAIAQALARSPEP